MKEVNHLFIFTYKNAYGTIIKTGIRDLNRKEAVKYFIGTHSPECQIIDIKTEYNYN